MFEKKKILKEIESKRVQQTIDGNQIMLIPVVGVYDDANLNVTLFDYETLEVYSEITKDLGILDIRENGCKGYLNSSEIPEIGGAINDLNLGRLTGNLKMVGYRIYEECIFFQEALVDYDVFKEYCKIRSK